MNKEAARLVNGVKDYCEEVVRPSSIPNAFYMGLWLGMRMALIRRDYCQTFTDLTEVPYLRGLDKPVINDLISQVPVG